MDENLAETIDQADQSVKNEPDFVIECLARDKLITQLTRAFAEPKYLASALNKQVVEYFGQRMSELEKMIASGHFSEIESFVELLIAAPFVLQAACDKTGQQLARLARNLLEYLLKYLQAPEASDDLETAAFMLSLSVWSLMVTKNSRPLFVEMLVKGSGQHACLDSLVDLLSKTEERVRKLRADKESSFLKLEKSLKHQLRTLSYVMTAVKLTKEGLKQFKESIGPITDLLKWQLASPYHEVSDFRGQFLQIFHFKCTFQSFQVRMTCLLILNSFYDQPGQQKEGDEVDNETPLEICLKAEKTPASLDEYRKKQFYLQRLEASLPANKDHQEVRPSGHSTE